MPSVANHIGTAGTERALEEARLKGSRKFNTLKAIGKCAFHSALNRLFAMRYAQVKSLKKFCRAPAQMGLTVYFIACGA